MMMVVSDSGKEAGTVRPAAVAGAFYPANAGELQAMIDRQMNHARRLGRPSRRVCRRGLRRR